MTALEKLSLALKQRGVCTPEEAEFIKTVYDLAKQKGVDVSPDVLLEPTVPQLPTVPAPTGLSYRDYQKVPAYLLSRQDGLVLADAVGLGKTIMAIGVLNHLRPQKVLLVVPAFLRFNWQKELERWLTYEPEITLLSYEKFIKHPAPKYDIAIFDEAHQLKGISKRTVKMLQTEAEKFLFITATPIFTSAGDMAFILTKAKNPHRKVEKTYEVHSIYWGFVKENCYIINTSYGQKPGKVKAPLKLRAKYAEVFLRRRVKDVLSELPEKIINPVWLDAGQEVRKDLEEELKEYLAGKQGEHLSHVRQRIALAKLPHVVSLSKEILETENRLIIVAWHKDVAKAYASFLEKEGYKVFLITGEVDQKDRDWYVSRFQSDTQERLVIVGTMGAMGAGLTLTKASHMVLAELDYVPARVVQAMGRIHRIGTVKNPVYYFPLYLGSVEERIYQTLMDRSMESSLLISQEAPVELSRRKLR